MAHQELQDILEILQGKIKEEDYSLKVVGNVFLEILKKNKEKYEEFKQNITTKWEKHKQDNQNRKIKKTFTFFFYTHFHDFLKSLPGLN